MQGGTALKRLESIGGQAARLFRHNGAPRRTIVAIEQPRPNALSWGFSKSGTTPTRYAIADFNVTNIWTQDIRLAGALLRYRHRLLAHRTARGQTLVKDFQSEYSGDYPLRPDQMTWVRVSFLDPLAAEPPAGDFIADVAIIDQFGNHHWHRRLRFRHQNRMLD